MLLFGGVVHTTPESILVRGVVAAPLLGTVNLSGLMSTGAAQKPGPLARFGVGGWLPGGVRTLPCLWARLRPQSVLAL